MNSRDGRSLSEGYHGSTCCPMGSKASIGQHARLDVYIKRSGGGSGINMRSSRFQSLDPLDCVPQELASDSFLAHDRIPIYNPSLRVSQYLYSCAAASSRRCIQQI